MPSQLTIALGAIAGLLEYHEEEGKLHSFVS
jgi:hypothetical protein